MKSNQRRYLIFGIFLILLSVAIIAQSGGAKTTVLTTSGLDSAASAGRLLDAKYNPITGVVTGKLVGASGDSTTTAYMGYVAGDEAFNALAEDARRSNPGFTWDTGARSPSVLVTLLSSILPMLLILGFAMYMLRSLSNKSGGGILSFGKSKGRRISREDVRVTFDDVAGADEALQELREIKEFLEAPERFKALGAKIPTGVLLVGPPGTGKTLLARAVAGEAGVPFFTVSGSDFVEMFVGVGSARMRSMFEEAKAAAPAIIFIDEIDAVGRQRGAGVGGGNDEREQTLNSLLVEMDGFHGNADVIVMAATNRPDVLDPALLRPGRFDRQVVVDLPDLDGRAAILAIHAKGKPLAEGVSLRNLARITAGMSGADLANLLNEGAILAARCGGGEITQKNLSDATERIIAGAERRGRGLSDREKMTVAYHEAGHAIVGHELKGDPIHKVTIIPRGRALGYTLALPEEDTFLDSRQGLLDDLAMLLGGRAAEELAIGDVTTGAGNDLERATKLAKAMVMRFGMGESVGLRVLGSPSRDVFLGRDLADAPDYGPEMASSVDSEIGGILSESYLRAKTILDGARERLDTMARVLLEVETIEGDTLAALLDGTWKQG